MTAALVFLTRGKPAAYPRLMWIAAWFDIFVLVVGLPRDIEWFRQTFL